MHIVALKSPDSRDHRSVIHPETIQKITGHQGKIFWDEGKPDGTPRKLLDVSKMKTMGWAYSTELEEGIKKTYRWFLENITNFKEVKL